MSESKSKRAKRFAGEAWYMAISMADEENPQIPKHAKKHWRRLMLSMADKENPWGPSPVRELMTEFIIQRRMQEVADEYLGRSGDE